MAILFLATVEHRHGTDTYHAWSSDELVKQLYGYVQQWWEEVFEDVTEDPIPDDPQVAVDNYFNNNEGESYQWREIEVGDIPDAANVNEMKKIVKELAQLAEELIQDRGRRLFDCQVDVVKAHERIQEARKLIAKKKGGRANEGEPVLQGGSQRQGVPCPDSEGE